MTQTLPSNSSSEQAPAHVLVVEDEAIIASIHINYLEAAGYRTSWLDSGEHVVDWAGHHHPDLIILDLMLPIVDGLEICRQLREYSDVPIIIVTAKVEEIDRLLGLELGADDYLCKPFSPREMVARVKALIRRSRMTQADSVAMGGFHINEQQLVISYKGHVFELTVREYRLLKTLLTQPGRVFSRAQLLDQTNEQNEEVFDRVIDTHVKNVRKKLRGIADDQVAILSVYGVGYKLEYKV